MATINIPQIRFKGFEGEWEERKLNYYLEVSEDKNSKNKYGIYDVLSVSGEFGVVNQIEFQGRSFAGTSVSNYGILRTGEVTYTKSPLKSCPYGIIKANKSKTGIVSVLYGVFKSKGVNTYFIQDYFDLIPRLNNYLRPLVNKGAKNTLLISDENSLNGTVIFPLSTEEQTRIASLFTALDKQISTSEAKLEKLRTIKKTLLKKMFAAQGDPTPQIRFKGFEGEWEEKKLGEIANRLTRKNSNNECDLPLTIASQYGLIDQREYFNFRVASSNLTNYFLLKKGEFAYNKSTSDGYPWGSIKRLDRYPMGVLSTLYIIFELKNNSVVSDYVVSYYNTKNWYNSVKKIAAEGARNHGLLNISPIDFFTTKIQLPQNKNEQTRIASLFTALDKQISTSEAKLEKLRTIKKTLLKKMFV